MAARTNRMITLLIVALVLVTIAPTFTGKVIYVDDDGPADFNNIQAAIDGSGDGDIIIVAEGRYFENINFNGRNITLTSTDPCNPDVVAATIIDGNQNGSVVTFNSFEDANCVLNGFTITNGNAVFGGGIYCALPFPPGPLPPPEPVFHGPTIKNCIISNNSAIWGGGMLNFENSPTLKNCTFTGNSAISSRLSGGAGGGIYNGRSNPTLRNCTFSGNSATYDGGGMFNFESSPIITNCIFNENSAEFGGGMYNYVYRSTWGMEPSNPTLTNCAFNGDSASDSGGGMFNSWSSPTLKNCTFSSNSARHQGGGMVNDRSSPTLTNCMFNGNSSQSGGGMYSTKSNPTLINCAFSGNSATYDGGGMVNDHSSPIVTNCIFSANCVELPEIIIRIYSYYGFGGGMCNYSGSPIVDNCMFTGNSAGYFYGRGGGMFNDQSSPKVKKCTFSGNLARYGGGIYSTYDPAAIIRIITPTVVNCIFWDNGSYGISGSSVDATYSDIEGGWPGQGNIDADPCFVDLGYWDTNDTPYEPRDDVWIEGDYHLLPDSPCINTGDPNHLYDPNETDLDGRPRVIGGRIDMGAYETPIPAEARIIPRTINLNSKGKWITCYIWLPEGYDVADIDPNSVFLEDEIQPEKLFINEQEQVVTAIFSREEVQAILNIGEVELTINAQLMDATYFEGTDVIKVIRESGGKLAKLVQASDPNPADGAMNVSTNADLSWTAGPYATSHNVYFGTSGEPPFVCNQTLATFDPGTMDYETTYYWHIDEVSKWGITTGQLWRFTTLRDPGPGTGTGTTGPGTGTTGPGTGTTGTGTGPTGPGTGPGTGTTGPGTGTGTGP